MKGIMSYWHIDITVIIISLMVLAAYFFLSGGRLQKGAQTYFSGLLILLLAESSPLHFLGMHYLFSAHMVIHVCLLLVCAPLLVLGVPLHAGSKGEAYLYRFSVFISHYPWLSWMAGIGVMWFWHIPKVFDAAFVGMQAPVSIVALLHSFSLLIAGIVFCWPLIGPFSWLRIQPPLGVVYLFTACICCSFLGLLITFSPLGIYHHYEMAGTMPFGQVIRQNWGISMHDDQQAAGLIMWVPCCFIYLAGCVYLMIKWFNEKDNASLPAHSISTNIEELL